MRLEDVRVGQKVTLTIDRDRFDPGELAYLLPHVDQRSFIVGGFFEATLPEQHVMVTLTHDRKDGAVVKAYLANADEIELSEE
jgi:hypothetical protein